MKAWRLKDANRTLEILDIDEGTRKVVKSLFLKLRHPMSEIEAQQYVESHYPQYEAPHA